ncbi:MAG TPA: 2-methylthioadenine synthetase, partial [Acidilobales archaeon]|nr:2-methylthioadenine synthetase [Acidilobales archaeon]
MKVYFEVYGCTLNKADTSLMKSLIIKAGHEISYNIEQADVIVINTCTVRKDTEERMLRRIRYLHDYALKNGKKLVVAGCMVSAQPYTVLKTAPLASLLSPQNITRIVEVIESNNKLMLIKGERDINYLSIHMEGVIAAIPIAEGCLG